MVRVKELEAENSQLKCMYANLTPGERGDQGGIKEAVAPSEHRDTVSRLAQDQKLPIRRSCQLMNLSRTAYYREENKLAMRDAPVVEALNAVVAKHGR